MRRNQFGEEEGISFGDLGFQMPIEHRCGDVRRQLYIWADLWPVRKCLSGDSQKQHGTGIQWECRGRSSEEVAERQQFFQECELCRHPEKEVKCKETLVV